MLAFEKKGDGIICRFYANIIHGNKYLMLIVDKLSRIWRHGSQLGGFRYVTRVMRRGIFMVDLRSPFSSRREIGEEGKLAPEPTVVKKRRTQDGLETAVSHMHITTFLLRFRVKDLAARILSSLFSRLGH